MASVSCTTCNDNGWLKAKAGIIRCQCKAEEDALHLREILWRICDLPEGLRSLSLSEFDVTQRGNRKSRDAVVSFLNGSLGTPWLLIQGGFETGKTHLAACVVNGTIEQGKYALYRYVPKLLQRLKDSFGGNYAEEYSQLEEPDVLVLDDLGVEQWSDWAIETLTILFEHYYEERKQLVVMSNLDLGEWPARVGRIRRRLEDPERCTIIVNDAPRFRGGRQ